MDDNRFDTMARSLSAWPSRRGFLRGFAVAGIAGALGVPEIGAGPGCKNVGATCKKASDCCSNVCVGKKRKKGKKPRKTCRAHDASTCRAGENRCTGAQIECTTTLGETFGGCLTTTGNAPYCSIHGVSPIPCAKDAECVQPCGAGAACVKCPGTFEGLTQVCVGLSRDCDA